MASGYVLRHTHRVARRAGRAVSTDAIGTAHPSPDFQMSVLWAYRRRPACQRSRHDLIAWSIWDRFCGKRAPSRKDRWHRKQHGLISMVRASLLRTLRVPSAPTAEIRYPDSVRKLHGTGFSEARKLGGQIPAGPASCFVSIIIHGSQHALLFDPSGRA